MHRMLKEKREKEKKNFLFFILISVLKNIYENLKIVIKKSNRALQKCFVYFKFKNREFLFTNGGSHPMSIISYATAFSRFTSEKKKSIICITQHIISLLILITTISRIYWDVAIRRVLKGYL